MHSQGRRRHCEHQGVNASSDDTPKLARENENEQKIVVVVIIIHKRRVKGTYKL
jgi:hypothetical protein